MRGHGIASSVGSESLRKTLVQVALEFFYLILSNPRRVAETEKQTNHREVL
jgi:hypothetical protein